MRICLQRRWFCLGLPFLLVVVAVVGMGYLGLHEPLVSQATCDRVQLGMTPEQVDDVLDFRFADYPSSPYGTLTRCAREDIVGNRIEVTFDPKCQLKEAQGEK